ncbi:MAG: ribosomal protein L7/L12 [Rhodospirillaceae bacterium]|nr:ribosomal protein L7/L12 [Rhodospirillaceae bacterium]
MDGIADWIAGLTGVEQKYGYLIIGLILGSVIGRIWRGGKLAREVAARQGSAGGPTRIVRTDDAAGSVKVLLNGQPLAVSAETMAEVRRRHAAGDKIGAIKHLREATRIGLAEAKELVETLDS